MFEKTYVTRRYDRPIAIDISVKPTSGAEIDRKVSQFSFRLSRRSCYVAIVLVWTLATAAFSLQLQSPSTRAQPRSRRLIVEPPVSASYEARVPEMRFTDVTAVAGIDFVHSNGATGERLLPETMGGGVAFFDFDNDGVPDLLLVNSENSPSHSRAGQTLMGSRLYHNDGRGHFANVTHGSGLEIDMYGMGVAIGDYDNDGLPDVLFTGVGGCRLFHNEGGGKFADVTGSASIGGSSSDWYTSASFFDYDNDGKLDLFVCTYVAWSPTLDKSHHASPPRYVPPYFFRGSSCRLYHNDGGGHFTDVSEASGIWITNAKNQEPAAKALGVTPIDLNGDGFIDLIVANDSVPNFVFLNHRDGTFKEIAMPSGVALDPAGKSRASMGIDAAWFRRDGALGIAIGTFTNENTAFYVSQSKPLLYTDETVSVGIGPASKNPLKFGVMFFDADLDGWEDLITADGQIDPEIANDENGFLYAQAAQFFWNSHGDGSFIRVLSEKCGKELFKPLVGRGSSFADIDGDGDLDLIVTQVGGPPLLLRNDQHLGHHWLRLKLVGTSCNRDAIGAQIRVTVGKQQITRQVMPTRGYLSQSELPVTIGLGNADRPERVEIIWPGDEAQLVPEVNCDSLTVVVQPAAGAPNVRRPVRSAE